MHRKTLNVHKPFSLLTSAPSDSRAVAQGKRLGRPKIELELERRAQRELRNGKGILKVAKQLGLGTGTVHRIARELGA
jgi:hypothetical protein